MKTLSVLAVLLMGVLPQATSIADAQTRISYQVIEPHPEAVQKILPYIQTRYRDGRLWIVDLKSPNTPTWVFKMLRVADPTKLRHYTPDSNMLKRFALPPINTAYLSAIKTENLQATVVKMASYRDRSAGSSENLAARQWIEAQLLGLGLEVKLDCYREGVCSVLAQKRGSTKPDEVILVEGHFDSVGRDYAGADDNASGTASTIEIARVLKNYANKKTLRFFLTNGEELGLYGSEHYAKVLENAGQVKNLKLVINMDMVGYNSNGIVELETDAPFNGLAQWFAELASKYTTLKSKITLGAWGSDHVPFLHLGVPTLLTLEDWSTKTPCYHQTCDKPETMNFQYATEITKLNTAAVLTHDAE